MSQKLIISSHLKDNNTSTFVARRQQITVMIEFYARNHIGVCDVVVKSAFDLWETPTRFAMTWNAKRMSVIIDEIQLDVDVRCKHNQESVRTLVKDLSHLVRKWSDTGKKVKFDYHKLRHH